MQRLTRVLALAATAATVLVTPTLASAREDMDAHRFVEVCDTDKDGMVSKAEVMRQVEKMFDKHDAKKSGKLDKRQVESFLRELMRSGA